MKITSSTIEEHKRIEEEVKKIVDPKYIERADGTRITLRNNKKIETYKKLENLKSYNSTHNIYTAGDYEVLVSKRTILQHKPMYIHTAIQTEECIEIRTAAIHSEVSGVIALDDGEFAKRELVDQEEAKIVGNVVYSSVSREHAVGLFVEEAKHIFIYAVTKENHEETVEDKVTIDHSDSNTPHLHLMHSGIIGVNMINKAVLSLGGVLTAYSDKSPEHAKQLYHDYIEANGVKYIYIHETNGLGHEKAITAEIASEHDEYYIVAKGRLVMKKNVGMADNIYDFGVVAWSDVSPAHAKQLFDKCNASEKARESDRIEYIYIASKQDNGDVISNRHEIESEDFQEIILKKSFRGFDKIKIKDLDKVVHGKEMKPGKPLITFVASRDSVRSTSVLIFYYMPPINNPIGQKLYIAEEVTKDLIITLTVTIEKDMGNAYKLDLRGCLKKDFTTGYDNTNGNRTYTSLVSEEDAMKQLGNCIDEETKQNEIQEEIYKVLANTGNVNISSDESIDKLKKK